MTVYFAAARTAARSPVARILTRRPVEHVANDDGDRYAEDKILYAALRHFAEHGLGAAQAARSRAETAFFVGDSEGYRWWLGICRTLDRRMAEEIARRNALASA